VSDDLVDFVPVDQASALRSLDDAVQDERKRCADILRAALEKVEGGQAADRNEGDFDE